MFPRHFLSASHAENAHATVHPANKCVFKEGRKPRACRRAAHDVFNFVRIHQTLRTTPAMAAGITKRLWETTDVVEMLETFEAGRDYGNSN